MSGTMCARCRDRRRKKMALFLQELLSWPGRWACHGSDQLVWYSKSPHWLQWFYFSAFLFAVFSPSLTAIHIFVFFWNPAHTPSVMKCVLTTWASSSLISHGTPKSACIFQLLCTDCHTLEDEGLPKTLQFWKKMISKPPTMASRALHSLVSTSPLHSSLPAFSSG